MWVIPRIIVNKILGHAQRTAPQECVGILSGKGQEIQGWHALNNQLQENQRFLADPSEQIQLFTKLRDQGLDLVAIYHSHPTGPAVPSKEDLAQSHYPEALYLIVSLDIDGCLEMNGFLINDGQIIPQEVTIRD